MVGKPAGSVHLLDVRSHDHALRAAGRDRFENFAQATDVPATRSGLPRVGSVWGCVQRPSSDVEEHPTFAL